MSENQKKSVYDLPKMVTDNPQGNFETMLNLIYGKDGWSYIRYGNKDMPITDFCLKELCPKFGCPEFADQTMTAKEQDELLFDCVFDGCPVATVYAALSGYGHLRDRLRKHEDAMKVSTQEDERDVESVRHGYWIIPTPPDAYTYCKIVCSVCNKVAGKHQTEYCPRCGAKMDLPRPRGNSDGPNAETPQADQDRA